MMPSIRAIKQVRKPIYVIDAGGQIGIAQGGGVVSASLPLSDPASRERRFPWMAFVPPLHPASMGSPDFIRTHGLRYPYVVGAMANGITSTKMVEAAGRAGLLGYLRRRRSCPTAN